MYAPAYSEHFTLSIPRIEHDFQVLSFRGSEAINQPYWFFVELVSEHPALNLENLLHQPAFLAFAGPAKGVHGLIDSVAQGESGKRLTHYKIRLVPRLAYLQYATNQRIFQDLSVPQVISAVLKEHGILSDVFQFELSDGSPKRPYCTQYDETDLGFIQRLCAEEGIHYHFQHRTDGHQLIFGDSQTVFSTLAPTRFSQGNGLVADDPVVTGFNLRVETRASRIVRRDYNFEKSRLLMEAAAGSQTQPNLEDYSYPGGFADRQYGKQLANRMLERSRTDYCLAKGKSNQPQLVSGHFLPLTEHPQHDWNDLWLLTEVIHEGEQPLVLEESLSRDLTPEDGFTQGYRNRFTATPWDAVFRPPSSYGKPRLAGSQSAVVTGPEGQEVHCDEQGRVKVRFHWDRLGQANDRSSCWLRVASNWAGDRYGSIAIPRVGMEVAVSFLEADPDRPLITGCLYHSAHPAPYSLPEHKTRSGFKTSSSPGSEGFNELRIEDKTGEEQIFVRAQRDWNQTIQNDQRIHVGNECRTRVEANSYAELLAEEHHTGHADRKTELKSDDHLTVGKAQHVRVGDSQLLKAGQEIHLKAGQKMVIEAGMEMTLKASGSFIKIDPSGVTLIGPQIGLNTGGRVRKGSGLQILRPVASGLADTSQPAAIPAPALANAQLNMAREARRLGVSRCPVCETCGESGACPV